MTIDEAIKITELKIASPWSSYTMMVEFYDLCADALRLAKKASEENGLTEETEKVCSELKVMENPDCWQARMKREYRETKEWAEKLYSTIVKNEADTLDFTLNCPVELLKRQYGHMSDYLYTLEVRAEIEGVNLHD